MSYRAACARFAAEVASPLWGRAQRDKALVSASLTIYSEVKVGSFMTNNMTRFYFRKMPCEFVPHFIVKVSSIRSSYIFDETSRLNLVIVRYY